MVKLRSVHMQPASCRAWPSVLLLLLLATAQPAALSPVNTTHALLRHEDALYPAKEAGVGPSDLGGLEPLQLYEHFRQKRQAQESGSGYDDQDDGSADEEDGGYQPDQSQPTQDGSGGGQDAGSDGENNDGGDQGAQTPATTQEASPTDTYEGGAGSPAGETNTQPEQSGKFVIAISTFSALITLPSRRVSRNNICV